MNTDHAFTAFKRDISVLCDFLYFQDVGEKMMTKLSKFKTHHDNQGFTLVRQQKFFWGVVLGEFD